MKTKLVIAALLVGCTLGVTAAKIKDPVLMQINGKDVKLSEFEYLYHKNNQQQIEKESLEQYLDRFILYKLKVADAEAAGIDTTDIFKKEYDGYKKDLQAPYLEDTTYRWQFIQEAYDFSKRNVDIDHFMLRLGTNEQQTNEQIARMDSIRNCVLAGENWEDLVEKYSVDPSKARNKGHYGYIRSGVFPYSFEKVAFTTPVGEISKPFRTDFGIHMVRVNQVRPDEGSVHVKHILKLFPRNATEQQKAETKRLADSVYQVIMTGGNFEEIAKTESQDPGSAKNGGDLPWFGRGRMVPQFEQVAFDLPDGAISQPFETAYGYHIVKKIGKKGVPSLEESRKDIETRINKDERARMIREAYVNKLKNQYNFVINPKLEGYIDKELAKHGKFDSTFVADVIAKSDIPLYTFANAQSQPLSVLASRLNTKANLSNDDARNYIISSIDPIADKQLTDYYVDNVAETNPELRNLLTEYRDGMLLYEISNRRVWKAAGKDTVGLTQFFEANRTKYDWDEPHFKGIILSAKNDSVLNAVKQDINRFAPDTLTDGLHNKYGTDIRMERMIVKQGENALADYLLFNSGTKPERKNYSEFMVLSGNVINHPEELNDVKGMVTSDYQDVLEQRWVKELKAKYPVKVNNKVLKMVK